MGSTYSALFYHFVWGTKDRRRLIGAEWEARLHAWLEGAVRQMDAVAEVVNGMDDHVHLLVSLRATHAPAKVARDIKGGSSLQTAPNVVPKLIVTLRKGRLGERLQEPPEPITSVAGTSEEEGYRGSVIDHFKGLHKPSWLPRPGAPNLILGDLLPGIHLALHPGH